MLCRCIVLTYYYYYYGFPDVLSRLVFELNARELCKEFNASCLLFLHMRILKFKAIIQPYYITSILHTSHTFRYWCNCRESSNFMGRANRTAHYYLPRSVTFSTQLLGPCRVPQSSQQFALEGESVPTQLYQSTYIYIIARPRLL